MTGKSSHKYKLSYISLKLKNWIHVQDPFSQIQSHMDPKSVLVWPDHKIRENINSQ